MGPRRSQRADVKSRRGHGLRQCAVVQLGVMRQHNQGAVGRERLLRQGFVGPGTLQANAGKPFVGGIRCARVDHPYPVTRRDRQRRQRLGDMHRADNHDLPGQLINGEPTLPSSAMRGGWYRPEPPAPLPGPAASCRRPGPAVFLHRSPNSGREPGCGLAAALVSVFPESRVACQAMASTKISISPPHSRPGANSPSLTPKRAVRFCRRSVPFAPARSRHSPHSPPIPIPRRRRHRAPRYDCRPGAAPSRRSAPPWPRPPWPRSQPPAATARTSASVAGKDMRSSNGSPNDGPLWTSLGYSSGAAAATASCLTLVPS